MPTAQQQGKRGAHRTITPKEIQAAREEIQKERQRQISAEGYDKAHDDAHSDRSLLRAGVIYLHEGDPILGAPKTPGGIPFGWPWRREDWKPKDRRRNIIVGGALCLAERDRLRRSHLAVGPADHKYKIAIHELAVFDAMSRQRSRP